MMFHIQHVKLHRRRNIRGFSSCGVGDVCGGRSWQDLNISQHMDTVPVSLNYYKAQGHTSVNCNCMKIILDLILRLKRKDHELILQ